MAILQAIPFWSGSFITGVLAVLYAKMFAFAEKGTLFLLHKQVWYLLIVSPLCFLAAWWVVKKNAPFSKGSGIPQVMASIELAKPGESGKINRLLSLRIIVVKVASSLLMVLGGGVIGREGPTIQIAASVFRKINLGLPDWWPKISKRNMILTGAAAGLAAAFNTPLGGIVFAVEELSKTHINYFKTALFTAVIIAGLTAQALAGRYLYIGYPEITNLSPYIFIGVMAVAIIAGLAGSAMCKIMLSVLSWKKRFTAQWQHILFLICCSLLVVLPALFIDERTIGSGKDYMLEMLFSGNKYSDWYMPFLRIAGSVVSFTTGAAGGVFAPALSSGASIGSWISGLFHLSDTNTNLLILAGMVAFLTGVTRTPFTSAILVLEMTDRHAIIFYLMLAGMLAGFVSLIVDKHSFYDRLKQNYLRELEKEDAEARNISTRPGTKIPA